jgi:hypothetical protein
MFESHPTEVACKAGHKESPGLISVMFVGGQGANFLKPSGFFPYHQV